MALLLSIVLIWILSGLTTLQMIDSVEGNDSRKSYTVGRIKNIVVSPLLTVRVSYIHHILHMVGILYPPHMNKLYQDGLIKQ